MLLNYNVIICLVCETCFEIKKEYFNEGFPLEIYEILMCIQATFFLSHKIRKNTQFFLVFPLDNLIIQFNSNKLRYLGPDERSIGMLLMKALGKQKSLMDSKKRETTPGIWTIKKNFADFLPEIIKGTVILVNDDNSNVKLSKNLQSELILVIPQNKNMKFYIERNLLKSGLLKFGVKDIPRQMKNYLTILKFYSIIDEF